MQNPYIAFPYLGRTSEGHDVHSGVMPHDGGGYYAVAYCPAADGAKRRTVLFYGYPTFEDALAAAQNKAVSWFEDLDAPAPPAAVAAV
jgi:hypothetical protein